MEVQFCVKGFCVNCSLWKTVFIFKFLKYVSLNILKSFLILVKRLKRILKNTNRKKNKKTKGTVVPGFQIHVITLSALKKKEQRNRNK